MFIQNLTLKNFGRHAAIDFDMTSSLVGILGDNFTGKTTVLTAIRWLLTNNLDDELVSYIRNYDPEGPRGQKAEGELTFRHKGRVLTIRRNIMVGTKAAEIFFLENGPIRPEGTEKDRKADVTGTRAVDLWLIQFLGLGKQDVAKAIFVKQGELASLMEGTPTERYATFARLMDVTYVSDSERRVLKALDQLKQGYVDVGPALVTAKAALTAEQEALGAAREAGAQLPVTFEKRLPKLRSLSGERGSLADMTNSLRRAEQAAASIDDELKAFAALHPDLPGLREEQRLASETAGGIELELAGHTRRVDLVRRLDAAKEKKKTAQQSILRLAGGPKPDALSSELATAKERKTYLEGDLQIALKHIAAEEAETTARAELLRVTNLRGGLSADGIEVHEENAQTLRKHIAEDEFQLSLLKPFLATHDHGADQECPICRSTTPPDKADIARRVKEAETRRADDVRDLSTETRLINSIRQADQTIRSKEALLQSAEKTALNTPIPMLDPVLAEQEASTLAISIRELEAKLKIANENKRLLDLARSDIENLTNEINVLTGDIALLPSEESTEASRARQSELKRRVGEIEVILRENDRLQLRARNRGGLATLQDDYEAKVLRISTALSELGLQESYDPDEDITSEIRRLELEQTDYRQAEAAVIAAQASVTRAEAQLQRVEVEAKLNERKREKIEKLQLLKEALGRNGATGAYLRAVFSKVLAVSQKYLSMMNSPMAVFSAPEDAFALVFRDMTNDTAKPLPQSKLSGAQKVRLALAFLLAIHELIVSEMGFLVLDEPSQNLSAETGVQDLKDLLETIRDQFANKDSQILVVDHAPALRTVMGSVLQL